MFEWNRDENAHGKYSTFIDDTTIEHCPTGEYNDWCIFTASNAVSPTPRFKKFKYEITIIETCNNTPYMNARIGFVNYPISESLFRLNGDNLAERKQDVQTAVRLFVDNEALELYNFNTPSNGVMDITCSGMKHKFGDRYSNWKSFMLL